MPFMTDAEIMALPKGWPRIEALKYNRLHRWQRQNAVRARDMVRNWQRAHPEETRGHKRKTKYGIIDNQYEDMLEAQGYKCAICHDDLLAVASRHIDHCHNTGEVRGILCRRCNLGLGHFRDSIELLAAAAIYLDGDHNGKVHAAA